jgi:cell division septum initiation protein DivIVA
MAELDELKQAIQAGKSMFDAFAKGDELIALVENAEANLQQLSDAQTRETNKLTNLKNEVADLEKTVKTRMDKAEKAAQQIVSDAETEAKRITDEAKAASDKLIGDKEDRAEQLTDQIAHDEEKLEALQNRIELARTEEDRVNEAIRVATAKIKNFTGE